MRKLVIAKMPIKTKEAIVTVMFLDDQPVEIYIDKEDEGISVGDIYVGYVERILQPTGGAFVRLNDKEKGFLNKNKMKDPVYKTVKNSSEIKPGDEILVQVESEAVGEKHVVLNTRLRIPGDKELVESIKEKGIHRTVNSCLYKAPSSYETVFNKYKDIEDGFERVVTDVPQVNEKLGEQAVLYNDKLVPLYKLYNFGALFEKCTQKKVWISNGGHLVIEQTEAFVVIDVNSAKAVKAGKETGDFLKINLDAAKECMHQIRLRQLSGIILIDFINMKSKEDQTELLSYVKELAAEDPVYTNVIDITPLGIMELTRHKIKKSLERQISSI